MDKLDYKDQILSAYDTCLQELNRLQYPLIFKELNSSFEHLTEKHFTILRQSLDSLESLGFLEDKIKSIYDLMKYKNCCKIDIIIHNNAPEYLKRVNLDERIDLSKFFEKLEMKYLQNDAILLDLAPYEKSKLNLNISIKFLAEILSDHFQVLKRFKELLFLKYLGSKDIPKPFDNNVELKLIIWKFLKNKYPNIAKNLSAIVHRTTEIFLEEFIISFESNKNINFYTLQAKNFVPKVCLTLKENFQIQDFEFFYIETYEETMETIRGLLGRNFKEMKISSNDYLLGNLENMKKRIRKLYEDEEYELLSRNRLKELGKHLFLIILTTDYYELNPDRFSIYQSYLKEFFKKFCAQKAEKYPDFNKVYEWLETKEKCYENKMKMLEILKNSSEKWSRDADEDLVLYAFTHVYVCFTKELTSSLKKFYDSDLHYMLKCIFRNISWGSCRYSNYQYLKELEHLDCEVRKFSSDALDKAAKDTLKIIRETTNVHFKEHYKHKDQVSNLIYQLPSSIEVPNKFFFEKVFASDSKKRSKSIMIVISGYTSEDYNKKNLYLDMVDYHSYAEIFALHWESMRAAELVEISKELITSLPKKMISQLVQIFTKQPGQLENVEDSFINKAWFNTYNIAVKTGVFLAHLLADTTLFKDRSVSLAGFSLATVVVMNCIFELHRIGAKNIIYDVLITGGVIERYKIEHYHLDVITNNFINIYSHKDLILKYILKIADTERQPAGLEPLSIKHPKMKNIDSTKLVGGHLEYEDKMINNISRIDFCEDINFKLYNN